jgi:hypothetical protein
MGLYEGGAEQPNETNNLANDSLGNMRRFYNSYYSLREKTKSGRRKTRK